MDLDALPAVPGAPQDRRAADVGDLFDHVQLHEPGAAHLSVRGIEPGRVLVRQVLDTGCSMPRLTQSTKPPDRHGRVAPVRVQCAAPSKGSLGFAHLTRFVCQPRGHLSAAAESSSGLDSSEGRGPLLQERLHSFDAMSPAIRSNATPSCRCMRRARLLRVCGPLRAMTATAPWVGCSTSSRAGLDHLGGAQRPFDRTQLRGIHTGAFGSSELLSGGITMEFGRSERADVSERGVQGGCLVCRNPDCSTAQPRSQSALLERLHAPSDQ